MAVSYLYIIMASSNPTAGFIFTHVGLRVADIDRSVAFYRKAFGMTEISRISLETSTVVFLAYPHDNQPEPSSVFEREGVLELVSSKVVPPLSEYRSLWDELVADITQEADPD